MWGSKRFTEGVEITRGLARIVPRGTIGEAILRQVPEECFSCDERARSNRGPAARFAALRLRQWKTDSNSPKTEALRNTADLGLQRKRRAAAPRKVEKRPFPKIPAKKPIQEEEEEETTPVSDVDCDPDEPSTGGPGGAAAAPGPQAITACPLGPSQPKCGEQQRRLDELSHQRRISQVSDISGMVPTAQMGMPTARWECRSQVPLL